MGNDDEAHRRRRKENADLMRRWREGSNLCHTDLNAFRWAPRPMIKKDERDMARLYGTKLPERPKLGLVDGGEAHGD